MRPFRSFPKWAKVAAVATGISFVGGVAVVYKYRPHWSHNTELHEQHAENPERQIDPKHLEEKLARFGRAVTIGTVSTALVTLLKNAETVKVLEQKKLDKYTLNARGGRPLVTVCNHDSVLDDPGIISILSPYRILLKPHKFRTGVCSEELCFANPIFGTFFNLGNGIPIQRGGTIHQKALASLQSKLNTGGWVHIFPEGRVWQEGGDPFRDAEGRRCSDNGRCTPPYSKLGPFKWGVGKLVANTPINPIIVPFFHIGMEHVMPQDSSNQLVGVIPRSGSVVTIKVGDPVDCGDLVAAYHEAAAIRARRRKDHGGKSTGFGTPAVPDIKVDFISRDDEIVSTRKLASNILVPAYREAPLLAKPPDHDSLSPEEAVIEEKFRLQLYSDITQRIFEAMTVLEKEVLEYRRDQGLADIDNVFK